MPEPTTAVAGLSAAGGLLGSEGSSSTSNKIDDRLAPYVYGKNGKGGLLGDIDALYRQQMGQGGLNDMQRAGLESQRQVLASPQYTQGYEAMRSLGMGLMGGGVARNPFNSGSMGGGYGGGGGMQQGGGGMQQGPMGGNPTAEIQRQFNALSTGGGGQAALDDWFRATQYSPEQINAAMPQYATADLGREMGRARGPVRPNTNMQYQPYQPQQNPAMQAMNTPIQSVSQYQATQPQTTAPDAQTVDEMIDAYMRENGLGKYAGGPGASPFQSGL